MNTTNKIASSRGLKIALRRAANKYGVVIGDIVVDKNTVKFQLTNDQNINQKLKDIAATNGHTFVE